MSYKASVIISIYNNVKFLKVVLDSLKLQTEQNFEIIISEDAEHVHVKEFLNSYSFSNDYQHLTQPDNGWQKNKALNNAIKAAKSEWLIFIDGDCVLHPRFVEFHVRYAHPDHILAGKRVKLNKFLTDKLVSNISYIHKLPKILSRNLLSAHHDNIGFIEEGVFINPRGILGFIPKIRSMSQLKGCNMSFSKQAAYAINGFDENFRKPAIGEDIDLTWRFHYAGYKLKSLRNLGVQYHLDHDLNWIDQEENISIMKQKESKYEFFCKNGLYKKLQEADRKKVLVLELLSWHDECLFSECKLLKENGFHVALIADKKLRDKQNILSEVVDEFLFLNFHDGIKTFAALLRLRKFISEKQFINVFFNTAQGNPVWKFFLFPVLSRLNVVGTLHNVCKLKTSYSQRFITSRIKRYFLLSDILIPEYKSLTNKSVSVFYPIFFPERNILDIHKPSNEIWITIPGSVDFRRRDYNFLLSNKEIFMINSNIKFIILGNINNYDGKTVLQKIKFMKLEKSFIFFDSYVSDDLFYSYIQKTDYFLPLIHLDIDALKVYVSSKVSGTYSLAYGYKIPMLFEKSMLQYADFKDSSYFYSKENFIEFINSLVNTASSNESLFSLKKWDIESQKQVFREVFD